MAALDRRVVSLILDKLELKDIVRCALVNRLWRSVALDDSRWQQYCESDLDETQMKDNLWGKEQLSTWYETYMSYMHKFAGLKLRHVDCCVAIRFWQAVRKWAEVHFELLLQTLNPGLHPDVIREVQSQVEHPIPDVLLALYTIADGQTLPCASADLAHDMAKTLQANSNPPLTARQAMFAGVFGKSSTHQTHGIMADFARGASGLFAAADRRDAVQERAYGNVLLTRMQRSQEGALFARYAPQLLAQHGPDTGLRAGYFTLSRSNMQPMSIVVDVRHSDSPGGPKVLRHNPVEVTSYSATGASPAHYQQVLDLVTERGKARALADYGSASAPELCAWLEGFSTQIKTGQAVKKRAVLGMYHLPVTYLELIPSMDMAAEVVTQGIRVRSIAWATPHAEHNGNLLFSYRIEFSHVIKPGDPVPQGMVRQAQLRLRHWDIFAPGGELPIQEVQGDGVVGEYPVIEPGASHDYVSMCPGQYGGGMEGWFLFAYKANGTDVMVKVECPRIEFREPDFLY
eukprot:jgi/Ulvmu1/1961/UM012_0122.1